MLPTRQGWITIDLPLVTAARALTLHIQTIVQDEGSAKVKPPLQPMQIVESTERILVPISEIDSIEILSLLPLLQAIRKDFPKWDGLSDSLAVIFREKRIDPRVRYNKFYSTTSADIAALYPWNGRSLFSLAGNFSKLLFFSALTIFPHILDQRDAWILLKAQKKRIFAKKPFG
jgi:hypothetical protein